MSDPRPLKKRKVKIDVVAKKKALLPKPSTSSNTQPSKEIKKKVQKSVKLEQVQVTQTKPVQKEKPVTLSKPLNGSDKKPSKTRLTIVAGSYDKILYGLQVDPSVREKGDEVEMKPIFVFPAHISCVKAVTASPQGGKWLATGSTDEVIKVWDLRRRKELGSLQQHQGSITYLHFPTKSHLLSAAEDGTIYLYHTRDWSILATLNGHKGRVNDVAVHPSAKVCLSVGKDRTLRMWDLMRGKGSASTKLGKEGEGVRWSPSGTRFAIFAESTVDIYSTKMALLQAFNHASRIHSICFSRTSSDKEVLLVAGEDKRVSIYLLPSLEENPGDGEREAPPLLANLSGHTNRVKAIDILDWQEKTFAVTVSSDGRIHLYDLAPALGTAGGDEPLDCAPISAYDTNGSRLTCVALAAVDEDHMEEVLKRKREMESDESSDDD